MERIVIIRHAHRDLSKGRSLDNGLDTKGKLQAKLATAFFLKRFKGEKPIIYSSPSKRCVQTVEKIAKKSRTRVQIEYDLVEKDFIKPESEVAFKKRVERFLSNLKKSSSSMTVLCSHGDWIPIALEALGGISLELKKGGWAEFKRDKNRWKLNLMIQSLKDLP